MLGITCVYAYIYIYRYCMHICTDTDIYIYIYIHIYGYVYIYIIYIYGYMDRYLYGYIYIYMGIYMDIYIYIIIYPGLSWHVMISSLLPPQQDHPIGTRPLAARVSWTGLRPSGWRWKIVKKIHLFDWLVVLTILKNISQWEG